jgi:hypothetical protein
MKAKRAQACQVARRLLEAIGYLELGMAEQAKSCLVVAGRNATFAPVAKMIRDEMTRRKERLGDDAVALEVMHPMAPEPVDHEIVLALTRCYRQAGNGKNPLWASADTRSTSQGRRGKAGPKHGPPL